LITLTVDIILPVAVVVMSVRLRFRQQLILNRICMI
jgi:hypothetical protein